MNLPFPTSREPLSPQEIYYRIHQEAGSDKTPVVLLHGLMGFAANWGKVWPALSKDRPVLVLDQCGHGRSASRPTGYKPGDYASDLVGVLNLLNWKNCHIVGHSMGGRVALAFSANYPQRTKTLSIEDSGMLARSERTEWIKNLLGSVPTPFSNREEAKKFFANAYAPPSLLGNFLYSNLEEKSDGAYDWRFYKPAMLETIQQGRAVDAMNIFKNIKLPTLIIRGELSEEFPAHEADTMLASRSNTQLVTIAGAGHFVHAEKPVPFTQALRDFLNQND
jgi:esterase